MHLNMGKQDRLEIEFMKSIWQLTSIAFVTIDLTLGEEKNEGTTNILHIHCRCIPGDGSLVRKKVV